MNKTPKITKHRLFSKADIQALEWFESVGAQCWRDKTGWTVQVFLRTVKPHVVIQPTRATLRQAIEIAREEYAQAMKANA